MKKEEFEAKIAELEAQIAELKKTQTEDEKPKPPHPRPYPENDQFYYYVNAAGEVNETKWNADYFDLDACEIGNAFVTQAEAEFAIERLKVLAEMREWAGNWDDPYILYYDHISGYVGTIYTQNTNLNLTYGEMRYATKADAEECIKAVGEDRIKKYYFRIPEETEND